MNNGRQRTVQTVALVGSYVPRQCGIASFSKDLRDAIAAEIGERNTTVVAIDDIAAGYNYPQEVRLQIPQHNLADYITTGELLNINRIDMAIIEHEYGLFGGRDGAYILDLVRTLRMPVITTLHTVLATPSPTQKTVLKELAHESDRVVVMAHKAEQMLREIYDVPKEKIALIPHGIPEIPFVDPHFYSDQFGVENKKVLLTFGLLGPGKGIEVAINALPKIVAKHPEVVYIVLGSTHPNLLRTEGNAYRNSLERLVEKLGLQQHVRFHNRFATLEELRSYLGVTDIYISPYPNPAQITSGTLSYAVGAGKVVVSTPYWHAQELLAEGRGRLFDFNNSEQLAEQVIELLDNDLERNQIRKRAYMHSRTMIWPAVGVEYVELAEKVMRDRRRSPRALTMSRQVPIDLSTLPDLRISHLRRLSDDTGILQHAAYATPNREHGYCTDDNARALIAALMYYDLTKDESALKLVDTYLSFIHHAFNTTNRRFRNFMSYDRRWLEEVGSEDVHGRAIWSLGVAVQLAPNEAILSMATRLFHDGLEMTDRFTSPRTWAFALVGIHNYLQRIPGDTEARRVRTFLAEKLQQLFNCVANADWPWCEDVVTYDNAKLAHAILLAGQGMGNAAMIETGIRALEWLVTIQSMSNGVVSLIGSNGFYQRDGKRARFDQQPIEAMAMVEACAAAYRVTGEEKWFEHARRMLAWFTGNNDTHSTLYDDQTGGCRDGLHSDGPNLNQGAESTLAWLMALMTVMDLNRSRIVPTSPVAESAASN